MACASCERNGQWMKRQYERSKESMRIRIERLGFKVARTEQSATEESKHSDRAEQSTDSDQQRTERTDQ